MGPHGVLAAPSLPAVLFAEPLGDAEAKSVRLCSLRRIRQPQKDEARREAPCEKFLTPAEAMEALGPQCLQCPKGPPLGDEALETRSLSGGPSVSCLEETQEALAAGGLTHAASMSSDASAGFTAVIKAKHQEQHQQQQQDEADLYVLGSLGSYMAGAFTRLYDMAGSAAAEVRGAAEAAVSVVHSAAACTSTQSCIKGPEGGPLASQSHNPEKPHTEAPAFRTEEETLQHALQCLLSAQQRLQGLVSPTLLLEGSPRQLLLQRQQHQQEACCWRDVTKDFEDARRLMGPQISLLQRQLQHAFCCDPSEVSQRLVRWRRRMDWLRLSSSSSSSSSSSNSAAAARRLQAHRRDRRLLWAPSLRHEAACDVCLRVCLSDALQHISLVPPQLPQLLRGQQEPAARSSSSSSNNRRQPFSAVPLSAVCCVECVAWVQKQHFEFAWPSSSPLHARETLRLLAEAQEQQAAAYAAHSQAQGLLRLLCLSYSLPTSAGLELTECHAALNTAAAKMRDAVSFLQQNFTSLNSLFLPAASTLDIEVCAGLKQDLKEHLWQLSAAQAALQRKLQFLDEAQQQQQQQRQQQQQKQEKEQQQECGVPSVLSRAFSPCDCRQFVPAAACSTRAAGDCHSSIGSRTVFNSNSPQSSPFSEKLSRPLPDRQEPSEAYTLGLPHALQQETDSSSCFSACASEREPAAQSAECQGQPDCRPGITPRITIDPPDEDTCWEHQHHMQPLRLQQPGSSPRSTATSTLADEEQISPLSLDGTEGFARSFEALIGTDLMEAICGFAAEWLALPQPTSPSVSSAFRETTSSTADIFLSSDSEYVEEGFFPEAPVTDCQRVPSEAARSASFCCRQTAETPSAKDTEGPRGHLADTDLKCQHAERDANAAGREKPVGGQQCLEAVRADIGATLLSLTQTIKPETSPKEGLSPEALSASRESQCEKAAGKKAVPAGLAWLRPPPALPSSYAVCLRPIRRLRDLRRPATEKAVFTHGDSDVQQTATAGGPISTFLTG